jgi:hypothetical protein
VPRPDLIVPTKLNDNSIKLLLFSDLAFCCQSFQQLFNRQTPDEQRNRNSIHRNGVGFNASDAGVLSKYSEAAQSGALTPVDHKFVATLLQKYFGQIIDELRANNG